MGTYGCRRVDSGSGGSLDSGEISGEIMARI